MTKPSDSAAFIFDMIGQWDKMSGAAAGEGAGAGFRQMIDRALAAGNLPSKADLADIDARLGRVEAALFRIEGALAELKTAVPKTTMPGQTASDT